MFTQQVEVSVGAIARAQAQMDGFPDWHQVFRRVEHEDFICYFCAPSIAHKGEWVVVGKEN